MSTRPLIQGKCSVYKNKTFQKEHQASLVHDIDGGVFKVVSAGVDLLSFRAQEIVSWNRGTSGVVRKKRVTSISVNLKNSDEYVFEFESDDPGSYVKTRVAIAEAIRTDTARSEILQALKSNEVLPIQELCKILARLDLPSSYDDGRSIVESLITSGKVKGMIEGESFVSGPTIERFGVATRFELTPSGSFSLICPGCDAPLPLERKEPTGRCAHCGSSYAVPEKLLDLL